jgi:hypothetical protein
LKFRDICLENTGDVKSQVILEQLGRQMNDSQESCTSLFECSCPELDELVTLARAAGAYGSRLTGKSVLRVQRMHIEFSVVYRCWLGWLYNFRSG